MKLWRCIEYLKVVLNLARKKFSTPFDSPLDQGKMGIIRPRLVGLIIIYRFDDSCVLTQIQPQKFIIHISDQILKIGQTNYHSSTIDSLCYFEYVFRPLTAASFLPFKRLEGVFRDFRP